MGTFTSLVATAAEVISTVCVNSFDSKDIFAAEAGTMVVAAVSLGTFDSCVVPSAVIRTVAPREVDWMDIFTSGSEAVTREVILLSSFVDSVEPIAEVIRTVGVKTLDSEDVFDIDGEAIIDATVSLGSLDSCVNQNPEVIGTVAVEELDSMDIFTSRSEADITETLPLATFVC